MPTAVRVLFPSVSCFGPLFMVIGLQGPKASFFGSGLALIGAIMTSVALLLLFFIQARMVKAKPPA